MEKYYYTKWIKSNETIPFEENLMLSIDLELWEKIILLIKPAPSLAETKEDNVEICSTMVLTSDELDQIANAINAFDETHSLVVRNNLRINHVDPNKTWAANLIATFGANNLYRQKSIENYNLLFQDFASIMDKCGAGAVELAYMEMILLVPNAAFLQEEKDEFLKRFEAYLGKAATDAIKASMGL